MLLPVQIYVLVAFVQRKDTVFKVHHLGQPDHDCGQPDIAVY